MMVAPREKLLSAALRHLRDAEHLFASGSGDRSLDQAWHLAGFGPECARKAFLSDAIFDQVLGHEWSADSESLLEMALALDPSSWRHRLDGWAVRKPILCHWSPEHRYERTGTRLESETDQLLMAARDLVDDVLLGAWTDGSLESVEI